MNPINSRKERKRICMITGPLPDSIADADIVHISSILRLLEPLTEKIFVISRNFPENIYINNKIQIKNINHQSSSRWIFTRIPKFITMQLKISYQLFKLGKNIDIVLFSIGAAPQFIPMITARLMQKKIILLHPGLGITKEYAEILYKDSLMGVGRYTLPQIVEFLETISCNLSNKIIIYSSNSSQFVSKRYFNKISKKMSRFYVDNNLFSQKKKIIVRKNLIGYVGKFLDSKGVLNIIKAIPAILKEITDVKFIICGDGPLREDIEKEIKNANLNKIVTVTTWISHDELSNYLNEMKLLIIPSDTEVGPQILFESMACGTPILATPVGVIPDVIKDGETGFILKNNSPECISKNVKKILNYSDLDKIAKNASELIEKEYTYEATVERYKQILEFLNQKKKEAND